jgi:hypothetical protein
VGLAREAGLVSWTGWGGESRVAGEVSDGFRAGWRRRGKKRVAR